MTVLTLQPSAGIDTLVNQAVPTANYGIRVDLHAGHDSGSNWYIGLIKFDLSAVPVGAVITSAILSLYCTSEDSTSNFVVDAHRSLVQWFEGLKDGSAPDGGTDGSTFNLRNVNGSVAWASSLTNSVTNSNFVIPPTASTTITTTGQFFDWDVTTDVQGFVSGSLTNHGWFVRSSAGTVSSRKIFASSDNATAANHPKLTITYTSSAQGSASGTSVVVAFLGARVEIRGSSDGIATVTATLTSNSIFGSIAGTSTAIANIVAQVRLAGSIAGTSIATGRIAADAELAGIAGGTSTASALGSIDGQMRGTAFGVATVTAVGLALAIGVASARGCYGEALLYITDGTTKANGQLNLLSLIDPKVGYILNKYRPGIAQYKDGGTWSDSPHGTGRSLVKRVFANVIDIFELSAKSYNQDTLIEYIKELLGWQEAAADYETSDWASLPVYLVSKAKHESNPRYAHIRMMSVPELDNPYAQPFFGVKGAAIEQLTLRMERGIWTANPPGQYECVAISSLRSWTVAGWSTGS